MLRNFRLHQRGRSSASVAHAATDFSGIAIQSVSRLLSLLLLTFAVCGSAASQTPRVYRDAVDPQWLPGSEAFWYRVDLPNRGVEFVSVDAVRGHREPAFNHEDVASQVSQQLGRDIDGQRLPFQSLKYSEDQQQIQASGPDGLWTIDRESGNVSFHTAEDSDQRDASLFLPARRSVDKGPDTEIVVENQLDHSIQLIWISRDGSEQGYGSVAAGSSKTQHTFAGHVWLLKSADGRSLAAFEATKERLSVVVNDRSLKNVQKQKPAAPPKASTKKRSTEPIKSPDGAVAVYEQDHQLWLADRTSGGELKNRRSIANNADDRNTFRKNAARSRLVEMQYRRADESIGTPDVRWSPDSRHVLAFQTTVVPERRVYYVESSPHDQLQPVLQSYPYAKPGDPLPVRTPRLFRIDGTEVSISNSLFPNPFRLRFLKWSDDGTRFWMLYNERGHQVLRVLEVLADSGAVRAIIDERSDTFIHYSSSGKFELEWLNDHELLWASERSGWNHLYRYDVASGKVMNAITSGDWNVRRIEFIDRATKSIWFYAVGIRSDQDPYHEHFCRINFDGSGLIVLTEGDGTHEVEFSPDRRFLLDRYSRVDLPPVTELRRSTDGKLLTVLETADASEVLRDRPLPVRFSAKGRDQKTDIWGIIHLPHNFDRNRRYPVVENIYAGPHDHHVPKTFRSRYRHQHQIADRGMIVVQIDGMGTAWRSKAFHDVCYRNLKDAGFPDRIAWMKAAAEKYPAMDLSRVGIYGGSAGGQNAMAALLWHGTFYKAAVADCGCHDNRMDKLWWNEQWMGYPVGPHYAANSNMEHAHRLQGRLMLVVGELDRNVDPASTMQVVKKLIEADKDFDFLLVAGAGHGACERPYAAKRRARFLASALQADVVFER